MTLVPRNFYLEDIFDDLGRPPKINEMKCDVYEENGDYHIEMDIPGYDKKDIKIECDNGLINITAEKKEEINEENGKKYIRRERHYGKISRSFNFSEIDEDGITADFNNGILLITIPKSRKIDTKKIIEIN